MPMYIICFICVARPVLTGPVLTTIRDFVFAELVEFVLCIHINIIYIVYINIADFVGLNFCEIRGVLAKSAKFGRQQTGVL